MRKLMLVPAAILAAGMLSTAVYAQDPGPGDGGPGWHQSAAEQTAVNGIPPYGGAQA